jgi:hypothetical protein
VTGAVWLKADFLPAPTLGIGIGFGSQNQHQGLLQVSVFYHRGEGEYKAKRIASSVISWFARGTVVTKNAFSATVVKPPYQSPARIDPSGGWLIIPVSIPYLAFAPDPV